VISDITAEKQAEARVRHMAHYDSLTELPNRLMFNMGLNRAFADKRNQQRIALMYIDVDVFKSVNDMFGHPVGDAFLRAVASRLDACVTSTQLAGEAHLVARLGGDEFAVMLVGENVADQSIRLAEKLVEALAQPFEMSGHEINSSISVGVALAPEHGNTAQVLQSNADIALYVAKDEGRNRWEMFAPGMDVAVQERHAIERDLRSALVNDELRLFLQPLVDVETGKQAGFESLIRWEHPERGLVMPLDFIPVAEESGLIVPIGEWVLRTAMAEAASWEEPMTIAVNLSPVQLRSPNLLPTIINGLAETGLDPARLELEITEGVLLHDSEANIETLNRLHALGVKIALDDFGTGYASLNYLLTFPFDKIKIDRSFVTDLETRQDCREIVGAVIGLANRLGMCTLAEGVEHEAQLIKLREQGCEMVQGWLFGKAMPAAHYALERKAIIETPAEDAAPTIATPRRKAA
jgi:diguanylate cyclase (GGDEF)-like protein